MQAAYQRVERPEGMEERVDGGGFFGIAETERSGRYTLDVAPWRSVGDPPFLFGGIGLGAAVAATERLTGRATVWATSQYLNFAPRGAQVTIDVLSLVEGRFTTQARAVIRDGEREVLGASLSLGTRDDAPRRQWPAAPQVLPPDACAAMPIRWGSRPDDMYAYLDARVARGWDGPEEGAISLWLRPNAGQPIDRPMLALMGDFVPASIGNALGGGEGDVRVNSLDNSMRYLALVETEWVLAEVALHGAADGFAHGHMNLFAEDGTLMATASQSVIVRSVRHPIVAAPAGGS